MPVLPLALRRRTPWRLCAAAWLAAAAAVAAAGEPGAIQSAPLAARSGPRGATLFANLPPAATGVDVHNPYDDPKMWWENYREFSLGAIGSGMAAADFDGDGRVDLFIACKTKPNRLFRNLGGFRFEDVTEKAGVAGPTDVWKEGVTAVDVNNDGRIDLYVCRFGAPNLLYMNQGDGTFREEAAARGLAIADASNVGSFCDYDRDGWLDVYLQTNVLDGERRPNGQRDYLFRNNGDGTFTNVTEKSGLFAETQGHSATWWDFDEDGWPDIYVANDFRDPDQFYRNNGDGTFTNVLSWVVPHTPHSSMAADFGDINNDGHVDLLVADMAATTREKDHRSMAKLRAGLMDNEQRPEGAPQYMRNALFLGTGAGFVLEAAQMCGLEATDWTWTVRFEDLDDDGRLDAYFSNGMVRELHGSDVTKLMLTKENYADRIRIMKATPPLNETNLAYRNAGELRFHSVGPAWGLDHTGVTFASVFADFDGDGDMDLASLDYDGPVLVYRNDNDRGHRATIALRGTVSNRFGVGAIVRAETAAGLLVRPLMLSRGYQSTPEPVVHLGLGEADRIARLTVTWPSGAVQTFENLPADCRYTITEPAGPQPRPVAPPPAPVVRGQFSVIEDNSALKVVSKEKPASGQLRQPAWPFRLARGGPGVAFADLDGDGEDEFCLGGAEGEGAQLFSNLGDGTYLPAGTGAVGKAGAAADGPPLFFELNGDGRPDLLMPKAGDALPAGDPGYQPRLFVNDGRGRLQPAAADALPALRGSFGAAVAADFNRDGRVDVFLGGRLVPGRYPATPESYLLENRDGKLVDVTDTAAPALRRPGMVTAALATDVDGDGWTDLLLAFDWAGIGYFHNDAGQGWSDWSEQAGFASAPAGWWTSLAGGDFNGDGRPDYVAGNAGLNTMYRPTAERPVVLFAGDLDGSGRERLVEATYEGDVLYPTRSIVSLGPVFPALGRKFASYDAYAKARLEEVFSPERLAAARRLEAKELRSGVFLSQPDGSRRFTPLPAYVQLAPVFGAATGDFDGDGFTDLYVVQNSYAGIAEVGRFDGGASLLLRGDGTGALRPVPARESGLIVRRDAKGLAVTDFNGDGWPDFLATRNNDAVIAFRNGGVAGRGAFAVVLRGPAGNPTAVGARVRVVHADGRVQAAELAAGSGYRSQSTAALFFGVPPGNAPRVIEVRWPDGRTSTHPWSPNTRKFVLVPPAP